MRRLPLLTQFGLMIVLLLIISAAALWRISGQLSESAFTATDRTELESAIEAAGDWAEQAQRGEISRDELRRRVNPELNPGRVFLMLLDPQAPPSCLCLR